MDHLHVNEVALVGRLTAEPVFRVLPSGSGLVQWRLLVRRPPESWYGRTKGDAIVCMSFDEGFRDRVAGWSLGDLIEVRGALRRRAWRTPQGAVSSQYEVEAGAVTLVARRRPLEPGAVAPHRT